MYSSDTFKINLKGLDEGFCSLSFDLHDDYFKAVEAVEVNGGNVHVGLDVQRIGDMFTIDFHTVGTVVVQCDVCLDDMEQLVDANNRITVRFGEKYSDEDDESLVVDEDEGILDVSWLIYEFIALAIPVKRVHVSGKCNAGMIRKLEELSVAGNRDGDDAGVGDPRWRKLLQ